MPLKLLQGVSQAALPQCGSGESREQEKKSVEVTCTKLGALGRSSDRSRTDSPRKVKGEGVKLLILLLPGPAGLGCAQRKPCVVHFSC
jgi:hypothetical protein